MAVKFSQFTSTTDPTAIEKVVGYTTAGSVNFQIPTANLDTTYLITSPANGANQIDLTITGTKAGVSSNDIVEITGTGNISLTATAAGYNIDGGGGGVTTFTNTNDAAKRVAYETVNSTQTGNVTIGDVDLSAAFWAGGNNVILSAATGTTPVAADIIWFSDVGDDTIKQAAISTLPADSLQATCNVGNTTTTVINASAGSAAAPGYGINGDPNTGMFSAVSDTLGFSTGGTAALTIDATNNVGIGTTSPNVSLTINATDAVQFPAGTIAERNAITAANGMLRYNTDDNSFEGYIDNVWGAIGGGVSITKEQKTGNGTTTDFTLTTAAGCTVDNLAIYISGVYQNKLDASGAANFTVETVANPTLQFVSGGTPTAPPVTSTNGIEIVITR
tara:strand:- start:1798 stop:2967 length:1170 start_codon:yes stop_codon:yes gene_type:complete